MATFYNTSTVQYDDASTPYNGAPITYTYAGNIPLILRTKYDLSRIKYYRGNLKLILNPHGSYHRGAVIDPDTDGFFLMLSMSSTVIHRRYLPLDDAVVNAGCPQCGTLLYNNPARGTRG